MKAWLIAIAIAWHISSVGYSAEGDWPTWRGPSSDGYCAETNVPLKWDAKSIVWKTELPGDGQSSPVVLAIGFF
jgi:hypothetical protein